MTLLRSAGAHILRANSSEQVLAEQSLMPDSTAETERFSYEVPPRMASLSGVLSWTNAQVFQTSAPLRLHRADGELRCGVAPEGVANA